ncbi:hypothetical protein C8E84_3056 [Ornithinibacter aureus]|nr:hypothetical protein C8E84_3056 [Ornithinibacter aureus]
MTDSSPYELVLIPPAVRATRSAENSPASTALEEAPTGCRIASTMNAGK